MDAKTMTMPNGDIINLMDEEARNLLGDETLDTEAQTCTGAINELKQSLDGLETVDSLLVTPITVNNSTTTDTGTLTKSIADYRLIILEIQPNGAVQKVFYPYIGNNIALQGNIIQSMSVYSMGNITINNKNVTVQFNSCAGWNNFTLRQVYGFGKIN